LTLKRTQVEGIWERSAEENIHTKAREIREKLRKLHKENSVIRIFHKILLE